jgi:hypothetical protein
MHSWTLILFVSIWYFSDDLMVLEMCHTVFRDSLKKAQLGGFLEPFVHQLRSPGSRSCIDAPHCSLLGGDGYHGTSSVESSET